MSMWFYQINQKYWSPERYRVEIWEGQSWQWPIKSRYLKGNTPKAGDTVAFFYAPSGGPDPGFFGWAVILEWLHQTNEMTFRPVAPSDHLKMHPWWDAAASKIADAIRGKVKQGTFWFVPEDLARELRRGFTAWIAGGRQPAAPE